MMFSVAQAASSRIDQCDPSNITLNKKYLHTQKDGFIQ